MKKRPKVAKRVVRKRKEVLGDALEGGGEEMTRIDGMVTHAPPEPLQMIQRKQLIETLYLTGMSPGQVVRRTVETLGITDTQAYYALRQVKDDINRTFDGERTINRALQAERLKNDLVKMRSQLATNRVEGKRRVKGDTTWGDVTRHEKLLAALLGTNAPIKIDIQTDVQVGHTLTIMMAGMTDEAIEIAIAEQEAIETQGVLVAPAE